MIVYDQLYPTIKSGWYKRLKEFVPTFATYGGNVILIPPPYRTTYVGPDNQSLGYDPVSDLDIGQWEELRGGRASDAQSLAIEGARHGVRLMADLPIHQYGGKPPYVERNRKGNKDKTLAYKPESLFGGPRDRVIAYDENGDAFGIRINYQTSSPAGYMLKLKQQAIDFLDGVLGTIGGRFDAAKDESVATLKALDRATGYFDMAEAWYGDNAGLDRVWNQTKIPCVDFASHYTYQAISQQGAGLNALRYRQRYCDHNPAGAIIMVDNHDTDGKTANGQPTGVVNFKGWWYFDAATTPARAWCIYGGDYEVYDLQRLIHNYMWIHTRLAYGPKRWLISEADIAVWSRNGEGGNVGRSPGVVCGINADPFTTRWVWVDTPWHDTWVENYAVSGGPRVWIHADGRGCIPLPPNRYHRADNAVAYSLAGLSGPIQTHAVRLKLKDPLDFSNITVRL
jgi:alpha-amylase